MGTRQIYYEIKVVHLKNVKSNGEYFHTIREINEMAKEALVEKEAL